MNDGQPDAPAVHEEELESLRQLLQEHGKTWAVAAGIVLVVVCATVLYRVHARSVVHRSSAMLYAAQSVQDLEAVVEQYGSTPAVPLALLKLAKAYFDAGNYELAVQRYADFSRKFAEHPMAGVAELGRVHCLEARGQLQEALQAFEAYTEQRPGDFLMGQALLGKARCLEQLARPDEARIVYEDFIVGHPDSPWLPRARDMLESMDRRMNARANATPFGLVGDNQTGPVVGEIQWPFASAAPTGEAATEEDPQNAATNQPAD